MKLFHSPASPFVRKCVVVLHETGQFDDVELVPATGTPLDSSQMPTTHNPLGRIPTLLRDDGRALYDSRVITRYLDARAAAGLYPKARLWDVLTLEATADGIAETAVLLTYEGRLRKPDQQDANIADAYWTKIVRSVSALNSEWMAELSAPLDIGQIALATALAYLDFRHDARGWRQGNDALATWYAEFAERPSMQATVPA